MAVMTRIRNRMHFVLWSLLFLFVLSMAIGGLVGGANIIDQLLGRISPADAIGIVNDKIIDPDQYNNAVSMQIEQLRLQGETVDEPMLSRIRNDVWNSMVEDILVNEAIEEIGIIVTDDEILFHLENNPPPDIRRIFETDGQFDMAKYQQALNNPAAMDWSAVENWMRTFYLPRYKFQQYLNATLSIEPNDIMERYILENIKYTFEGIQVTAASREEFVTDPTDDEIEDEYKKTIDDYERDESREMRYVLWPKMPSASDTQSVLNFAEEIQSKLNEGADFAALADLYSEDPGNKVTPDSGRGGTLGWFGAGQMVKQFEDAAFGAKPGDVVSPVISQFGCHIIKVHDTRTKDGNKEVKASHILLKIEMGPSTSDEIRRKATLFAYDAQDYGFDAALDTHSVNAGRATGIRETSQFVSGIGPIRNAVRFAFDAEVGDISPVLEVDRQFAVAMLDSVVEAGRIPISDVNERLANRLRKSKASDLAEALAYEIRARIDGGESINDLIEEYETEKVQRVEKQTKKLNENLFTVGRSNFVNGALMSAKEGDFLGPLKTGHGYAVLRALGSSKVDSADYRLKEDAIFRQIYFEKQNSLYPQWIQSARENAEIVDNRKYYF
ncbi:MAG: peptidylprolyl isomerase [Candidatus Marinimicrobia bacterium]|nr:peptidylprolyl isomerase [Candidatus Neomarinimicrobiota bacterium]